MSEIPEPRLIDGSAPATPDRLFARLAELDISVETHRHEPVFTVEEAQRFRGTLPGGHTKNLFLRNKKGRMWLVVCGEERTIDLKELAGQLGAGRFSFGRPERLMSYLGVIPGAVTPFAIINDHTNAVVVVIERALIEHSLLNFHPLDNAMTSAIDPSDLLRFLESTGHPAELIDL